MTFLKSEKFRSLAFLTILSALVYLPFVNKLGYTHDDWYLMYAAKVKGISIFHTVFSGDRPLRAFVMMPAYWAFGENPLYYNLASYFFRLLGGISFLWALRLVWVKEKLPTFLMALLFLVYPGFLSHPNGVDYLSHQVALAFAPLSIAFTLKAILAKEKWQKFFFYILSVLLGSIYLGLMEYYIGIEALRFMLIFVILWRPTSNSPLRMESLKKVWRIIWQSIPFLLASLPFLYWRVFLFESERGATDTTQQLSGFLASPLGFLRLWGINLAEDFLKTLFGAWTIPFSQFYMKSAKFLAFMLGFFILIDLVYFLYDRFLNKENIQKKRWQIEALFVGFISLAFSLVPVVMVNRQVSFPHYSRYTLPGSFSAAMLLVTIIFFVRLQYFKEIFFTFLLLVAGMTHIANAQKFAAETASMNNFWWQVSWRVPHFGERTTLMVNYPVVSTEEDYFIWGPANQIYYPEGTSEKVVQPGIYAFILSQEAIDKIMARERQEFSERRGIESYPNARNILVLSQPTQNSCVQIIDGVNPEYSSAEKADIMKIGEFSEVEHILTDAQPHTPPEVLFGPEPAHGWCYIYQKATLARQKGDWDQVAALLTEAREKGSVPQDSVEWLPFIQASAMLGDGQHVREFASSLKDEPFILQQACESLRRMELTPEMRLLADDSYCIGQ
ncbi:MAG: hypothetical protein GY755_04050 [Chloroflexi bacterium]|nr:hypothetical protein [Chloroflexota bacterium]